MVNDTLTLRAMRRALALTNEAAGHPFRRSLPAYRENPGPQREPVTDLAFFAASFASWFVIIMGMIA